MTSAGTATHQPPHRDGNVLAGLLSEVFDVDLTGALRRCPHCGLLGALAQLHVYGRLPGLVARCPACSAIALRIARHPGALWLEFSGTGAVRIPLDAG
ncbi:hypothetical protein KQH42_19925 [Streptomyces sp. CHA1]|uniref:DUF6510 family protein n=1 Tax=unclassified Streptomyces TaxID=2593676 RepID=UPI001397D4F4|nr:MULTISPECIES: DUF6510 family protein [unclassified Streptomyces]MBP3079620.1 hypothetical protein [Streptomyces sp. 604F]MBT3156045.1 hypothetical protein [Streptomyces sp. G11C]MCO6702581.1 hypothetical protein [Streptomyces sp. CHB9.2]MCO6709031.1 hypothetical protein [Streptomyces sp. CHA3]MCO6714791.1 hypothetical protein [Streptomyces sp. CHB19.2]